MHYDVFNGDADGIIALLQLRLTQPKQSTLITGVKRDIKLLAQVSKRDDVSSVTTLDISMEKNIESLQSLLERDIEVFYCDHHRTGDVPASDKLTAVINLDSEVCTSLLIHQYLEDTHGDNPYVAWAIAGAFGDNLISTAMALANVHGFTQAQIEFLKELGTLINYNGYGASLSDLHIEPADLYRELLNYPSPFALLDEPTSPYYRLKQGYEDDYKNVNALVPIYNSDICAVYEFPAQAWARRTSGVYGNELANLSPSKAHAVLTLNPSGEDYTVSVRAPLTNRVGADEVCTQFPTGGGRKAAAGINQLPLEQKQAFIDALNGFYLN
ncbi:DHH family phosphoesterase [Vibrio maerlii]|uniref:DHH family phosphoesterase n=1 Tax=Vibrio maerlii TaxID=2231648 RepID=UPI000E3B9C6F|nr:DHH family phosphoesterase [Vibrio maerlii]